MAAAFFGATTRRPFLVFAAALCECRALLLALARRPLVVPWTIVAQPCQCQDASLASFHRNATMWVGSG